LLQPEKKRKQHGSAAEALRANGKDKGSKVPDHLKHFALKELPPATCPWSLSGPQFPQPTAIQQRYCYPKGNAEYAGRKGGALWTMYGRDGKEDFQFRLLHVYFSAKRATNKGVTLSGEDRMKQQLQNEAANAAAMAAAGTPNRKGKRVSRAARSPWQERASIRSNAGKRKYSSPGSTPEHDGKRPRRPTSPTLPFASGISLLPPPSPFQSSRDVLNGDGSIFVSPNTAASSDHGGPGVNPFDHDMFDHPTFHPVPSFDIDENIKPGHAAPKTQCPFRGTGGGRTSLEQFRQGRTFVEHGDSFVFNEAEATEVGGHASSMDSWNTHLLSLIEKPTFDHSDMKKAISSFCRNDGTPKSSAECLKERLGHVHERIRDGILAHPASKQGPLLSIVATWARSVAASPLVPTIQPQEDEGAKPIKVEPKSPSYETAAI
jgi:hypothetical protein